LADTNPPHGTQFGVRTGVYTEVSGAFVGAEVLTPIASAWYFNPNLEYAAGGGPAVIFREVGPGDRESDLGVNVLGGIGWKKPKVTPFVQTKITVSQDTEAVLAVGLRF
jgi:hypothetical protein